MTGCAAFAPLLRGRAVLTQFEGARATIAGQKPNHRGRKKEGAGAGFSPRPILSKSGTRQVCNQVWNGNIVDLDLESPRSNRTLTDKCTKVALLLSNRTLEVKAVQADSPQSSSP